MRRLTRPAQQATMVVSSLTQEENTMQRMMFFAPWLLAAALHAGEAQLTIKADQPGTRISPLLYGIFFEEINRAGDGGIYAEMIQNRSFEDAAAPVG